MRTSHSSSGPFIERPYFSTREIEDICADELRKAGLYPADPSPVRIERFLEKRFGVVPAYEDLPDGILGFTKFRPDGVEAIIVSRVLADEGTKAAERRISTTLGHEGGHGLLHAHLFALGLQAAPLFGGELDPATPKILCRDGGVAGVGKGQRSYDGRWWEHQANLAMGALLLPKTLVEKCLETILVARGTFGLPRLEAHRREQAVGLVSEVFDVNRVVARIRVTEMYPDGETRQLTL
jgi:hypothetical protein